MKDQHFFYLGLVVLLLAVLAACGQAPIAEPEPGQPAPVEVVAPQPETTTGSASTEARGGPGDLAWPPRPTQLHIADNAGVSLDEDGLAVYHQSEWGRIPSTALPVVENEANVNQDMGLMEFFAAPNETSQQRIEPDTAEAIHNIDPADRKFFTPGYGAQVVRSEKVEILSTIDPADRKFFTPGYGAQTVKFGEAEALPAATKNTADPDQDIGLLEFFSP